MSSHKYIRILTRTVDVYGDVASNLVSKVLHEHIQYVTVLLNRIFRFRDDVLSESLPCDNGRNLKRCKAQQLVKIHKSSWFPNSF